MTDDILNRFFDQAIPEPNSGCWLWSGSSTEDGYGRFQVNGKTRRAHRFAYEMLRGPIPTGRVIDHLCRVRCCVNPAHLEPVTVGENVRRSPIVCAPRAACSKGHPLVDGNIYWKKSGQRECLECKRVYNRSEEKRLCKQRKREADRLSALSPAKEEGR